MEDFLDVLVCARCGAAVAVYNEDDDVKCPVCDVDDDEELDKQFDLSYN